MFGFKAAAAVQVITSYDADPDSAYRAAWGISVSEWSALTDLQRIDYRDRVAYAPHIGAA